jgi:hypothetical protein
MLQKRSAAAPGGQLRRTCVFFIAVVAGCLSLPPIHAQSPCETALQSTADVLDVTPSSPLTIESVAEWESEIIKFRVTRTGLLTVGVEGAGAEASLLAQGGSGVRMANRATVEPGAPAATPVVPSEIYCLRLSPEAGGNPLAVELQLTDICQLGPNVDDHGNSFACATEITPGASLDGAMTAGDRDLFALSLTSERTVEIEGAGAASVSGQLFDAAGTLLVSEEDRGSGLGFLISETLAAGRYFVRVNGAGGAQGIYALSLDLLP